MKMLCNAMLNERKKTKFSLVQHTDAAFFWITLFFPFY